MKINRGAVDEKVLKFEEVGDVLVLQEKHSQSFVYLVLCKENVAKTHPRGGRVTVSHGHDSGLLNVDGIYYLTNLETMFSIPVRSREKSSVISKARCLFETGYDFVEVIPRKKCEVNIVG